MCITRLDPDDDRQWAAHHRATAESVLSRGPFADLSDAVSMRALHLYPGNFEQVLAWSAHLDGEVVGTAVARLPTADNRTMAMLDVQVIPRARGDGVGTALLTAVETEAAERGRVTLLMEVPRPLEGPASGVPGVRFARRHGFSRAQTEVHYVLRSPVHDAVLDHLQAEVDAAHGGYRLVSWAGRCPEDLVAGFCALEAAFVSEAPLGDLAVESEVWPPDRLRQFEDRAVRRGMRLFTTVALAGGGAVVGNTRLVVDRALRRGIDQGGTLVLPEHRGHRLGLAMKLANQRLLQRDHPVPALVHTYNAEENGPMIAVNRRLGFQPVELTDEWQRRGRGDA